MPIIRAEYVEFVDPEDHEAAGDDIEKLLAALRCTACEVKLIQKDHRTLKCPNCSNARVIVSRAAD